MNINENNINTSCQTMINNLKDYHINLNKNNNDVENSLKNFKFKNLYDTLESLKKSFDIIKPLIIEINDMSINNNNNTVLSDDLINKLNQIDLFNQDLENYSKQLI